MPLPSSGQIDLNDIHVEAGGSSGTQAAINDADIRALIGKSSGVQMAFSEWYGASSAPEFVGSHSRNTSVYRLNNMVPDLSLTSISGRTSGDLVMMAFSCDGSLGSEPTVTGLTSPSVLAWDRFGVGYGVIVGTYNGTDTIEFTGGSGQTSAICVSMFSGVSSASLYGSVATGTSGMPNPPSYVLGSGKVVYITGHLDDDLITATAPSGYTLSNTQQASYGSRRATGMDAYDLSPASSGNPGAFGGGGSDYRAACTIILS
jgi:hypothetical protein